MLLKTSVRAIAIYQLLSAAAFAYVTGWLLFSDQLLMGTTTIFALFVLLNGFAGVELLRGKRWGYWASFVNELFQIPSLAVPAFAYEYIGLGQVSVGAKINPSEVTYLFGFSADFSPGTFLLWFGDFPAESNIAIDVVSTSFAVVIWRMLRAAPAVEGQGLHETTHQTPRSDG